MEKKPVVYSGMQATGVPSLGNYLGAIKHWARMQQENDCLFCVVDLHSITVRQEPAQFRQKLRELYMLYIACGVNPETSIIYYQSQVAGHSELAWILNCFTYMGELNRMTQYKDKAAKHHDNLNAGLFTYPVLMAADILLFNTNLVPVGEDQRQHIELCRDVAMRFNKIYGDVFVIPEGMIHKVGAKIMSLQEPTKKMSKSETENLNNVIFLTDSPDVIRSKIKKAVTDSDGVIRLGDDKPGVSNLLTIYAASTGITPEQAVIEFEGQNYGTLKSRVAEAVVELITPIQTRFGELKSDRAYIDSLIKEHGERANAISERTMRKVRKKVGFYSPGN